MPHLTESTIVHAPRSFEFIEDGASIFLDAEAPHWIAVDKRGAEILRGLHGARPIGPLVGEYAARLGFETAKAWLHVHDFLQAGLRSGYLSLAPIERPPYEGRSRHAEPAGLREIWLHTNNSCNLLCSHCLVSSGPDQTRGLSHEALRTIVAEALELGAERFYLTGGEPFLRPDIESLVRQITDEEQRELIVLTNATLFGGPRGAALGGLSRDRVRFQVSIDGALRSTNDRIRGAGTYERVLSGVRTLAALGFQVSLTTVVTRHNLPELSGLTRIAAESGASAQHLMWSHRRGRALESIDGFFPSISEILPAVDASADEAARVGIPLDNLEVVRRRVNGQPGVKYDLGNAGWDSVCVYADGEVYPSAALADHPRLRCGRASERGLAGILRDSPVLRSFREASLVLRGQALDDPFRFLTGGGDIEHAYAFSSDGEGSGDLTAPDPYYPIAIHLVRRAIRETVQRVRQRWNRRSGYDVPALFHAMGEGSIACGLADGAAAEMPVLTLHSNCVLSFDVDKPRQMVREFYGKAAETPKASLCCPMGVDEAEVGHIPRPVVDRFYGCGSPVAAASLAEGETYLDLGSGAGIDVFIAAKKVGSSGRALGIDMTDEMLAVANENRPRVAENLGYDVVEFRRGFLEAVPIADRSVDVVTSNCVINLSPDKRRVFAEIWRILRDHGRVVISDIVSDRVVPPHLKTNPELWGECTVGALTDEGLLAALEQAGFYGIEVLGKTYWRSIEGYSFHSMTVRGYKLAKSPACNYRGQRATYLGPGKAFVDEEGHSFPRGLAVEVCTDTAAKLSRPPYATSFSVQEADDDGSLAPVMKRETDKSCEPGCC